MRLFTILGVIGLLICSTESTAQTPGVLYTWGGTGDIREWVAGSTQNTVNINNNTAGQLTVVELGDQADPFDPGLAHVIRDGFNRRLENADYQGGLDVWGLEALEIDLSHNGSGPVNVQFFVQATPDFNYVWAGNDGTLNGPDWTLSPNVLYTLRFPLGLLSSAQQSYIRTIGLSVRNHVSSGNVTWNIFEARSTGTSPTERYLATHNVGSSDAGLNGAFINFEQNAVVGNDGSQGQTGLSHNAGGPGSLRWTDKGNHGVTTNPSGAAISWVNGTVYDGNTFNERLADVSNYDTVTFRMSATDPLNGGGSFGVQAFFQTANYTFHVVGPGSGVGSFGEIPLPIDGQFHDLTFRLGNLLPDNGVPPSLQNVQAFGVNLFSHANDLLIDVDFVRFNEVELLDGDYNQDGKVDAADYIVYRKSQGLLGSYATWRQHFGESNVGGGSAAVPEPAGFGPFALWLVAAAAIRFRR